MGGSLCLCSQVVAHTSFRESGSEWLASGKPGNPDLQGPWRVKAASRYLFSLLPCRANQQRRVAALGSVLSASLAHSSHCFSPLFPTRLPFPPHNEEGSFWNMQYQSWMIGIEYLEDRTHFSFKMRAEVRAIVIQGLRRFLFGRS